MVVAWGPRVAGSANHEHGESHRRAYQRETAPRLRRRVECVIADTCIAGMAESAACEEKFSNQNVGVTITVTPAGATAAKPSTWIRCARRPSGALTAPSVRGRSIWPRRWRPIARKGSRRSPSTDMTCRMPMTRRSQRMSKKSCCASHAPAAVASMKGKAICRWAASQWASPDLSSTTTF